MSQLLNAAKDFVAEKAAGLKKPEADLTDVDLHNVSRDSVTMNCKISINNPYHHSIPICQISYALKSVDRVIVSGTIPDPGSIEGKEVTKLEVPVKVPYNVLMSLAKDIGSDWDIDYVMEMGLTIDLPIIGDLTLPLSKKGELKLPTFSDIFT